MTGRLTIAQAKKFSQLTHVPFGYLFLDRPPEQEQLPLTDFRTLAHNDPLSQDFYDVYYDIQRKQVWYRDYLVSVDAEPLSFVGKFNAKHQLAEEIAEDIRNTLDIKANLPGRKIKNEDYFSFLTSQAESAGILVFKSGMVGANTHRTLSLKEFRGFVIIDEYAPAVFINGKDSHAANTFTLIHEIAHIWRGQSGISDTSADTNNAEERLCNAVAAEVLVPKSLFVPEWAKHHGTDQEKISALSKSFNVSQLVIARRALDAGSIQYSLYKKISDATYNEHRKKLDSSEGGSPYSVFPVRNSRKLSRLITDMAVTGSITLKEASYVLNASPRFIVNYYEQQT